MGSSLSAARQLAQRLPQAPARKLKPFSPGEIEALNRIAAQDQARMKDLPSIDELNSKDVSLDQFLNKLGGAIEGRDLSPDAAPQPQDATGSRTEQRMPPARPPQALLRSDAKVRRSAPSADDQPGRLHSYVLREILEGRTAAAAERRQLDLEPYVRTWVGQAGSCGKLCNGKPALPRYTRRSTHLAPGCDRGLPCPRGVVNHADRVRSSDSATLSLTPPGTLLHAAGI